MTMPPMVPGPQAQPGQRMANGYVAMPGGYEAATQGQQQQGQQQMQMPRTPIGQPAQQAPIPGPQMQSQGWFPAPQPQPQQVAPQGYQSIPQQQQQAPQPMYQPQNLPPQPVPLSFPAPAPAVGGNNGAWPYGNNVQGQQPQQDLGNVRLQGPNIPAHLQGRSVNELISLSENLRQVHLGNLANPPAVQPPQQVPPRLAVQTPQQQTPEQQAQGGAFDWRNPAGSLQPIIANTVRDVIQQELAPTLQPVVANSMIQSARQARDSAAAQFGPLFQQLEPLVLQKLQGINPQSLSNPETWRVAADMSLGELARSGRLNQQPQQQQQPQQPGGYPVQYLNTVQNPVPNLNSFFTEQPNSGMQPGSGVAVTQADQMWAQALGMPVNDYMAWKGPGGAR